MKLEEMMAGGIIRNLENNVNQTQSLANLEALPNTENQKVLALTPRLIQC